MYSGINWDEEHRRTLLSGRATLENTSQSVARSQAIAIETEQIGTEVIAELDDQRNTLLRAKRRLSQTDQQLNKTHKVMNLMKLRVLTNKCVLILIIIIEISILVCVVYLKFFSKK